MTELPQAAIDAARREAAAQAPDLAHDLGADVSLTRQMVTMPGGPADCIAEAAAPHLRTIVEPIDVQPGGRIIIRIAAPSTAITAQYAAEAIARVLAALHLSPDTPAVVSTADVQVEADNRVPELEQLARDMLSRFTATGDGHRARVGQVQIGKWQAVLDGR